MPMATVEDEKSTKPWTAVLEKSATLRSELANALVSRQEELPWRSSASPLPARPMIIRREVARALGDIARRSVKLAVDECWRRVDNVEQLAEMLDVPFTGLMKHPSNWIRWGDSQARPDLVLESGIPRVLELNIGGAIGGESSAWLEQVFCSATLPSLPQLRLHGGRFLEDRLELLVRMAASRGVQRPRIAAAGFGPGYFREAIDRASQSGFSFDYVELADLVEDEGLRNLAGTKFDIFLQKFIASGAYADGEPMAALESAVLNDSCLVASPEVSSLYSNKRVLAWLWESVPGRSASDVEFIQRHIPWTARLVDQAIELHGRKVNCIEYSLQNRERLVLKPESSFGAQGVVLGRSCSDEEWSTQIASHFAQGRSVVQELCRVTPLSLPTMDPRGDGELISTQVNTVVSPFLISDRLSGFMMRFSADNEVVNGFDGSINAVLVSQ